MAVLALPTCQSVMYSTNDTILQSQLMDAIQLAKANVRVSHLPVSICKSGDLKQCGGEWGDGLLVFFDPDRKGSLSDPANKIAAIKLPANDGKLYWQSYPVYRNFFSLSPLHWLSVDNGMFWYCHPGDSLPAFAVIVSHKGRVRLALPNRKGEIRDSRSRVLGC